MDERDAYRLLRLANRLLVYGTTADPDGVIPASFMDEQKRRDLAALREISEVATRGVGCGRGPEGNTLMTAIYDLARIDPVVASILKVGAVYGWSETEMLAVMVRQLHGQNERLREQALNLMNHSPLPLVFPPDILAIFEKQIPKPVTPSDFGAAHA